MKIVTSNKEAGFPERFTGFAKSATIKCSKPLGISQTVQISSIGGTVMSFQMPCDGREFEISIGFDIDTDNLTIHVQEDCVIDVNIHTED